MTNKQSKKILKYVKEHSPKEFAARIEKRCQATLNLIKKLSDTPEDKIKNAYYLNFGCPHCDAPCNDECLWVKATPKNNYTLFRCHEPCTRVKFNGVTWKEVSDFVFLSPDNVMIIPWHYKGGIPSEHYTFFEEPIYDKAIKFLQGHIDWAREKGWGKKYRETY